MTTLDPSDVALTIDLVLAVTFAVYFALGRPRLWYRDRLGWVIFGYAVAVIALLSLIVYAVLFDRRVAEPYRMAVAVALGLALIAKTWSIYKERSRGRLPGERPNYRKAKAMTNSPNTAEALAPWYPAQRALRSIFGALVVLIPLVNGLAVAAVDYLQSQTDVVIPPAVFVWLNAIIAGTALIIGLVSRLMAVPGFNAWLTKIGLGTAPKSAIVMEPNAEGVYVLPPPTAD